MALTNYKNQRGKFFTQKNCAKRFFWHFAPLSQCSLQFCYCYFLMQICKKLVRHVLKFQFCLCIIHQPDVDSLNTKCLESHFTSLPLGKCSLGCDGGWK